MSTQTQFLKISANTRISTIIRANPAAIEVIASINKHFEKLRNPILRKVLASRVTIADAARIGGTKVEVFFDKLKSLGFVSDRVGEGTKISAPSSQPAFPPLGITLDVRETLQAGQDPFKEIITAAEKLSKNQSMLIINTFEPVPLYAVLRKKGFTHYTDQTEENLVHTYFYRTDKPENNAISGPDFLNSFERLQQQYQHSLIEIDVRNLEMPQPMMNILEALFKLTPEQALFVYHCRIPQYLLQELTARGFAFAIAEPGPDEVRLLIYKIPDHELHNC
ncbi:DUF2249 domain-containing protein [Adhaeribacter rhizoryzae]|uniref:DUF2249 domain-containing protein n=1 Tax=Adhaeribacter rhizoryzae TaxID=2607907 RepID=A0A5M6CXM4_9BACT|nr:DUF2249 domain-containing protein [Adhaeribacter rhizoryzae]KAA5539968.1 DUF2249 domain-containing protein [Adhaeribacter rhizoryzae]